MSLKAFEIPDVVYCEHASIKQLAIEFKPFRYRQFAWGDSMRMAASGCVIGIVLSDCLGTVALIAACAVVVEVQAKVWTLLYGHVVVTVQVTLVLVPLLAEFVEDDAYGWVIQAVCAAVADDVWLPTTVNALPTVSHKALDA
jgi:hypothetical protein